MTDLCKLVFESQDDVMEHGRDGMGGTDGNWLLQ